SHSSSGQSTTGTAAPRMPAAETRISMPPKAASAACAAAAIARASLTSRAQTITLASLARAAVATSSRPRGSRSMTSRLGAPSLAMRSATSRPSPDAAPVIAAILPANLAMLTTSQIERPEILEVEAAVDGPLEGDAAVAYDVEMLSEFERDRDVL